MWWTQHSLEVGWDSNTFKKPNLNQMIFQTISRWRTAEKNLLPHRSWNKIHLLSDMSRILYCFHNCLLKSQSLSSWTISLPKHKRKHVWDVSEMREKRFSEPLSFDLCPRTEEHCRSLSQLLLSRGIRQVISLSFPQHSSWIYSLDSHFHNTTFASVTYKLNASFFGLKYKYVSLNVIYKLECSKTMHLHLEDISIWAGLYSTESGTGEMAFSLYISMAEITC